MKIGLIGNGAIARYARAQLVARQHQIGAVLVRPERLANMVAAGEDCSLFVSCVSELPDDLDCVAECAGHGALAQYGPHILGAGHRLVTVSIGALADQALFETLESAARSGQSRLILASGAIGALDTLRAARVGPLTSVHYVGRKPPKGWKGSPAEAALDLDNLSGKAQTHFRGTARQAALDYPKNANVAAAVALAGVGFDNTQVELIADPTISANIHEICATGAFGAFQFQIDGQSLPDNPRSSALAAMSVVASIDDACTPVGF